MAHVVRRPSCLRSTRDKATRRTTKRHDGRQSDTTECRYVVSLCRDVVSLCRPSCRFVVRRVALSSVVSLCRPSCRFVVCRIALSCRNVVRRVALSCVDLNNLQHDNATRRTHRNVVRVRRPSTLPSRRAIKRHDARQTDTTHDSTRATLDGRHNVPSVVSLCRASCRFVVRRVALLCVVSLCRASCRFVARRPKARRTT